MKDKQIKQSLLDWLAFKQKLEYASHPFIGHLISCLLILTGAALLLGGAGAIIQFVAVVLAFEGDHEALRNIGLVVAAVIGAPFILWRAVVAQKQADTAEQSHITDQINKAVAGLGAERAVDRIGRPITISGAHGERTAIEWQGKPLVINEEEEVTERGDWQVFSETQPNLEVRIGSIYALERIAQDSHRDHIQIMEILTAYIRENAPVEELAAHDSFGRRPKPRTDIQAAIDVIGRRSAEQVKIEWEKKYRLDLRETNLSGANFTGGKFDGALFSGSRLHRCNLDAASLRGARLIGCSLLVKAFKKTDLTGAILDGAWFEVSSGTSGISHDPFIEAKSFRGLSLVEADISAIGFPREQTEQYPGCLTYGTRSTRLSRYAEERYESLRDDMEEFSAHIEVSDTIDDEKGLCDRLTKAGFLYWDPQIRDRHDHHFLREKLWDHLDLKGFPFED